MSIKHSGYRPLNSPIRWVGGKSRLRKYIIPLLPTHTCYVEPFAGAAWVMFGKEPSQIEIFNDIDGELVNFFRMVQHHPDALIHSFKWVLTSRDEFTRLANADTTTLSEVQRAHRFYYLIMAGWGGELKYPRFQTSITDGGHGNRLIGAVKDLRSRIEPIHQRLQTVIIENLDGLNCIDRYDRAGVVMYIDPPYPDNGVNYAHNMRDWASHESLASRLANTKCQWILSSYDKPMVRALFKDYHVIPIESVSGMRVRKNAGGRVRNQEVLITNFIPPTASALTAHSDAEQSQLQLLNIAEMSEDYQQYGN